ncbi:hypothetical protein SAMN05421853_11010 [Roseivivax halotolerans]|uniref:Uncharacterized protein n=1 Tax=Roseivivax halotolerans TaxID=93684 RepID=A0A1I5ZGT6_9RHOB|nr:hypothetical protein SAMN05421853_11010 [Roseivivax halotolerans]
MIAEIGRYLHQPIDAVLEWDDDEFFAFHDEIDRILGSERPKEK